MAGEIKRAIDKIIKDKAKGDPIIENSVKVKLILKGINIDSYTISSPDDPDVLNKIKQVAKDLGVTV